MARYITHQWILPLSEVKAMKVAVLKIPAVAALVLGAVTSANAAMPGQQPSNSDSSIVLVECAYGWYRGPDGQCYVGGTGPGYYGHRYYGYGGGGYYGHRRWYGDYYYRSPYRAYPYYGGYPYYGRPYGYDDDDE
jgi:hypothetical protein